MARSLRVYGDLLVSRLSLASCLAWLLGQLRVLPGGACISQSRHILARSTLGGWSSPPSFGSSQILLVPCSSSGPPVVRQLRQAGLATAGGFAQGSLTPCQMEPWTIALVRWGCNHSLGDLNNTYLFSRSSGDWKCGIKLGWLLRPLSLVCRWLPLEKAVAPHSSTLAWKIPWMEEPGRLRSMGSRRAGHD